MKPSVDDVWNLISQLTPQEKKIIYNKLHEDIKLKLNDILNNVSKRTESEKVDFKAITKEVELVREKNHAEN
ncbi:hypothetical protein [Clostridium luticellarii]|jgi:hypothetical protein|uniref:Uncharacterized protein n=1 Tax=Clostridium luticellarii TaxID=1691940 RepID=A0A2T0BCB4_9CLOT|nr:hypothetical protein [Clostridium luticellarii]PRR81485.1 hypothetical protein CLLU_31150 [Clostridium luticellarii]